MARSQSDLMGDIERVGPAKPLGYLPRNTITDICGRKVDDVKDWARAHGLKFLDLSEDDCTIWSGALYVWHDQALANLLARNATMLAEVGWPVTTKAFVRAVATRNGSEPRLRELIGRSFDDFRFPFKSPVLTV